MDSPKSWQIEFFTTENGRSPVKDYINSLTPKERVKVRNKLRLLKEFGTNLGEPNAKPLKRHKPLWELRPMPTRLFYVVVKNRRIIVLHGFKKTTNETPKKEIEIAENRYQIFLEQDEKREMK